ncbi:galactose oxidase [Alteromonas aestuariivivens]|uniref:Galactose oxidase n=1 Tax=Alteromonas aestuariivivens TaxID=1938339 RepID=A0A3D8MED1_9ALTE|nr:galactose oxidase [Alteromonas aestuariivivens]RDV28911.1 galactose oxidase [Alteromonas aestuariivivens]
MNKLFAFLFGSILTCHAKAATLPALPEPVTNNAVASLRLNQHQYLFSFMGLGAGKTHKDIHNRAWQLIIDPQGNTQGWQAIPSVPSSQSLSGRLASVAVGAGNYVYLFGGYTVSADHTEVSTPDVYRYNPLSKQYESLAPMPVPVDDAVALVYQNRFVYLISGWHNDGNVNLVQVYDTQTDRWQQASPYLGKPVFGHAGALSGQTMVVCDGVAVVPKFNARRGFEAETACFKGVIDSADPYKINWTMLAHPTGQSGYRMAAAADPDEQEIVFVGGATNPYNYDGIGYNGSPSQPSHAIWTFDVATQTWQVGRTQQASMDHRGLLRVGDEWLTLGGMGPNQTVLSSSRIVQLTDAH